MPSYKLIWVGGLKCKGNGVTIISNVNKWLLSKQEDYNRKAYVGIMFIRGWNRLCDSWDKLNGN